MKTRRMETSSTYENTPSNRMKLRSASFTIIILCEDERFDDIHILDGRTDRGRSLRLVFQDKGDRVARIFTG